MCLYKKNYRYHDITYKRVINKDACTLGDACYYLCTYSRGRFSCVFSSPCVIHNVLYCRFIFLSRRSKIFYVPV